MDCIEKFKGMQDCFREHPDVYGGELEEEEEGEGAEEGGLVGGEGRDERGGDRMGVPGKGSEGKDVETGDISTQVAIAKEEAKSSRRTADTESQVPKTPLASAASGQEDKADAAARTKRAKAATTQVE